MVTFWNNFFHGILRSSFYLILLQNLMSFSRLDSATEHLVYLWTSFIFTAVGARTATARQTEIKHFSIILENAKMSNLCMSILPSSISK